jgi:hypothetical protein
MTLARWKDLCLDATQPEPVGRFWADALGLQAAALDGGDWRLTGARPEQTVWINRVAEPKTVKNRVHVDLVVRSSDPMVADGGRLVRDVVEGDTRWSVVADPDGAELCVFDSAQGEASGLVVDSVDAVAQASWWAELLHAEVVSAPDGDPRWLAAVPGLPFETWKFVPVPEPKTVKNRVHWTWSRPTSTRSSGAARPSSGRRTTTPRGTCWPTPKATSSASSPPTPDPPTTGVDHAAREGRPNHRRSAPSPPAVDHAARDGSQLHDRQRRSSGLAAPSPRVTA